jgi:hypothetical protein
VNTVDTLLNFAWAFLCIGALVRNWWCERQRARPRSRRVRLLGGASVFMAGLLLFPCISISDDYARARLQDVNSIPSPHVSARKGESSNFLLASQLEETEHIRPVAPFVLALVLCFLLVILPEERGTVCASHWDTLGRAPPCVLVLPASEV